MTRILKVLTLWFTTKDFIHFLIRPRAIRLCVLQYTKRGHGLCYTIYFPSTFVTGWCILINDQINNRLPQPCAWMRIPVTSKTLACMQAHSYSFNAGLLEIEKFTENRLCSVTKQQEDHSGPV